MLMGLIASLVRMEGLFWELLSQLIAHVNVLLVMKARIVKLSLHV